MLIGIEAAFSIPTVSRQMGWAFVLTFKAASTPMPTSGGVGEPGVYAGAGQLAGPPRADEVA